MPTTLHRMYTVSLEFLLEYTTPLNYHFDLGCQFSAHLNNSTTFTYKPRCLLPWMHAKGHNLDCQLEFNGLYQVRLPTYFCVRDILCCSASAEAQTALINTLQENAARRGGGEQSEQAWARLKPISRRTRYMALAHRQDFIDDAFGLFNEDKFYALPGQLVNMYTNAIKCIGA